MGSRIFWVINKCKVNSKLLGWRMFQLWHETSASDCRLMFQRVRAKMIRLDAHMHLIFSFAREDVGFFFTMSSLHNYVFCIFRTVPTRWPTNPFLSGLCMQLEGTLNVKPSTSYFPRRLVSHALAPLKSRKYTFSIDLLMLISPFIMSSNCIQRHKKDGWVDSSRDCYLLHCCLLSYSLVLSPRLLPPPQSNTRTQREPRQDGQTVEQQGERLAEEGAS